MRLRARLERARQILFSGGGGGATGAGATNPFAASGSQSAGSSATTTSVLYTPTANTLGAQASGIKAVGNAQSSSTTSSISQSSSSYGGAVPLSAFVHIQNTTAPLSINRQGQFPAVTISFNLAPRAALGNAIEQIDKAVEDLHMPATVA